MSWKGKKNRYVCRDCGFAFITVDRDEGTTPFLTHCRHNSLCTGWAQSQFYSIDQTEEATYEWYIPNEEEMLYIVNPNVLEHIKMGGLLLRRIEKEDET